ncbi:MAG: hypothetical protein ACU0BB_11450 [Paracoccaceae bacterium]|jgi:hypothetical protein
MTRKLLLAAVAICAIGVAYATFRPQPEPTPAERLQQAAEDAQSALSDATDAAADSARAAGEAISADVQNSLADMAESIAAQSEDFSAGAQGLIAAWNETGIVTENGIDYAKASALVAQSDLAQGTKAQVDEILKQIEQSPENITKYLDELKALLAQQ